MYCLPHYLRNFRYLDAEAFGTKLGKGVTPDDFLPVASLRASCVPGALPAYPPTHPGYPGTRWPCQRACCFAAAAAPIGAVL